jgi:hypothetical protein
LIHEVLVRKDGHLLQPTHSLLMHVQMWPSEAIKIALLPNSFWEMFVLDVHVFRILHQSSEKMILEISNEESGTDIRV